MMVSTRINYDEIRKDVPNRYVLVFEVEDEDYFVSYDKDTTLGLNGSLNYTNEPISRMVIPFESAAIAFCGMLINRRGVAIAKRDHVAQRTGHEWWIERLIDNAHDVEEWVNESKKRGAIK